MWVSPELGLCFRVGYSLGYRIQAAFRIGIEGPLSSLHAGQSRGLEVGVGGPGLDLRLRSEERVAFLGFSHRISALYWGFTLLEFEKGQSRFQSWKSV